MHCKENKSNGVFSGDQEPEYIKYVSRRLWNKQNSRFITKITSWVDLALNYIEILKQMNPKYTNTWAVLNLPLGNMDHTFFW